MSCFVDDKRYGRNGLWEKENRGVAGLGVGELSGWNVAINPRHILFPYTTQFTPLYC